MSAMPWRSVSFPPSFVAMPGVWWLRRRLLPGRLFAGVGVAVVPPGTLGTVLLSLVRCVRMCRLGRAVDHRWADDVASGAGCPGRQVEVGGDVL
eukprot:7768845-Pyramimonas_sp.AAC.1